MAVDGGNKENSEPLQATRIWNSLLASFVHSVPVKRHRSRLRIIPDTFTGSTAVDSLMKVISSNPLVSCPTVSQAQAETLFAKFVQAGYISRADTELPTPRLASLKQLSSLNLTQDSADESLDTSGVTKIMPTSLFRICWPSVERHLADTGHSWNVSDDMKKKVRPDNEICVSGNVTDVMDMTSETIGDDTTVHDISIKSSSGQDASQSTMWTAEAKAKMNRAYLHAVSLETLNQLVDTPTIWADSYVNLMDSLLDCVTRSGLIGPSSAVQVRDLTKHLLVQDTLVDNLMRSAANNVVDVFTFDFKSGVTRRKTVRIVPSSVVDAMTSVSGTFQAGAPYVDVVRGQAYQFVLHYFVSLASPLVHGLLGRCLGDLLALPSPPQTECVSLTDFGHERPVTIHLDCDPDVREVTVDAKPSGPVSNFARNSLRVMSFRSGRHSSGVSVRPEVHDLQEANNLAATWPNSQQATDLSTACSNVTADGTVIPSKTVRKEKRKQRLKRHPTSSAGVREDEMDVEQRHQLISIVQLLMLTLPCVERSRLQTLLTFVHDLPTASESARRRVIDDIVPAVVAITRPGDRSRAVNFVSYLVAHAPAICRWPTELRQIVEQATYDSLVQRRIADGDDPNPITYCDRISRAQFERQREETSNAALAGLLDQMLSVQAASGSDTTVEQQAKLDHFRDAYPHIWSLRMGSNTATPHRRQVQPTSSSHILRSAQSFKARLKNVMTLRI